RLGTGKGSSRSTDGCSSERGRIGSSEDRGFGRRRLCHAGVTWHQLHSIKRGPVARDSVIAAGAAIHVLERDSRHAPTRPLAKIERGRKAPPQLPSIDVAGLLASE